MVQREIKSKTKVYATAAILLAVVLVGTIYTVTTPTVLYTLTGVSPLKTFASVDELRNYLTVNTQGDFTGYYGGGPLDSQRSNGMEDVFGIKSPAPQAATLGEAATSGAPTYSTTNVQVAGVDEADTVKTDGNYIYTLNENYTAEPTTTVYIVKANAPASVVGEINFDISTSCAGMFLSQNGNKLAVLGSKYSNNVYLPKPIGGTIGLTYDYYANSVKTFIYTYDVTDKANPTLTRNLTLSGSYFNSRMINNYVYTVVSQPAYLNNDTVILPQLCSGAESKEIPPTDIYYTDMQDNSFSYTTFAGVNIMDDSEAHTDMTIMMGGTSNMYVSSSNMYVTFPDKTGEGTEIYRVAINNADLTFAAQGVVSGYVLNQYSMDEYNGNFRIATTVSTGSWMNRDQHNNLYVLNMDLGVVGKIENLAQDERIYSARFVGDKAYLVTFKQTDPFFVLDLTNPTSPKVAGELKIPGYSSYLHPYNENYIIGIGKENNTVKLSLFEVTDMNNPTEIAKTIIGQDADYSDSIALYEPKAFMFDPQKQLLVIPVSITNYGYYPEPVPDSKTTDGNGSSIAPRAPEDSAKSSYVSETTNWIGAYVFNVSPANGFTLKGEITHQSTPGTSTWGYNYMAEGIQRSLYIDNTLYTISNNRVQLNNLQDLALVAKVNLP
jgi:uncharacterized secreted protein with C-terminal beta-propeller domain